MTEKAEGKDKKKGFFSRMFDKLDKKMEEKSKESKCCGGNKGKGGSCCS